MPTAIRKHVAQSGARAGQWVTCTAVGDCRLGGQHISEQTLYATRAWLDETGVHKKATEVNEADVNNFVAANLDPIEWNEKAELLARKAKAIKGTNAIRVGEIGRRILDGEKSNTVGVVGRRILAGEAPVKKAVLPQIASKLTNYTFTKKQWNDVLVKAQESGLVVKIVGDQKGHHYRGFEPTFKLDELRVTGEAEKVRELTSWMTELSNGNPHEINLGSGNVSGEVWLEINRFAASNNVLIGHSGYEAGPAWGLFGRTIVDVANVKFIGSLKDLDRVQRYFDSIKYL